MGLPRLIALVVAALLLAPPPAGAAALRYDRRIRRAAHTYLPAASAAFGWRILKSQYIAESGLDPRAVSPAGAAGIAQFMPATWRRQAALTGVPANASRYMPAYAIRVGAAYMHRLRGQWRAKRPARDRHSLALASYNAGLGHLLDAQRRAGGVRGAAPILAALPGVTGAANARETRCYVARVWRLWRRLEAGLRD